MTTLKEILQKKAEREIELRSSLDAIRNQIKDMGALKIILFGSLVRGEIDIDSDLDLLVIMPSTKSGKEWTKLIYESVERKIATDIIVYNHKEFEDDLHINRFLKNLLRSGEVIYEKTA